MFSILIPTYNNIDYLKICLNSLIKSSNFKHEIILHVNEGTDGTLNFLKLRNYKYTSSNKNVGLCSAINQASKLVTKKYILYAHDDMYFCPDWDKYLYEEVKNVGNEQFYLSGTMIEPESGHIKLNCGKTYDTFKEQKLLNEYKNYNLYDHQGTHFAPHLVTTKLWNKVGGFSEEFNPGIGSDPDFNMKLWKEGVRIFKGINKFEVYHFSSLTTRKNKFIKQNKGDEIFLKKWGYSSKFFKKHYLRSKTKYDGHLKLPSKNLIYYFDLFKSKINFIYISLKYQIIKPNEK